MQKTARTNVLGFTMVELLIVVSIIAILTGALIPSFASYTSAQELRQAQERLISDLYAVQNNALSGKQNKDDASVAYWGLRFNVGGLVPANVYEYVASDNANCGSAISQREIAFTQDDITIDGTLGNATCVFFYSANGDRSGVDTVAVKRGVDTKSVTINSMGLIIRN